MWFPILNTIIIIYISSINCEQQLVQNLDRLGNLTIKYGEATEIRFHVKDPNNKQLQVQLDLIRMEQLRQGGLLDELSNKLNMLSNLDEAPFASSCAAATALTRRSGIYQLLIPEHSVHPFLARCEEGVHGGGWTSVLRRKDGSIDFYRFWQQYKDGFGNVDGEFFIGLEKLYLMTKKLDQELLFVMEDFKGQNRYARYNKFAISSEQQGYALSVLGEYSGDAGDSFTGQSGHKFTSQDRDNDTHDKDNCAKMFTGGWWYASCHASNLMGKYNDNTFGKGINWLTFTTHTASLKRVEMLIRPKRS